MMRELLQQHPKLEKWFKKLDCISFSREVIKGDPETSVHKGHEHLLKLLKDDPKEAALYLLYRPDFLISIFMKKKK